ncbi:TonB-dependent receptor [Reichenbachiella agariperforans]|uniref:TonB-dependent receptor n=1 Tax=Reichenbachiella agariperforans TaxID=156994 RepID=UPI001C097C02|nr:TonB-dependent receptor [Reichenbachiella agariperforans]MBU2912822.1 TonB-dependent receptor [Reichenbachiella agariperforans]
MSLINSRGIVMLFMLVLFTVSSSFSQNKDPYKATLSGHIKSAYTGLDVIGATVYLESVQKGTATDVEGNFKIVVPKGLFKVRFSSVNMKTQIIEIDLIKDVNIEVELREEVLNLNEVTVFAEKQDANVKSLDVGKNELDINKINSMPAFMGEPDVVKSLMLLPGVSTVGEGASGFNVRGGGVDQNLILQDGALIFNPSHVFGFFSVFNPAVVKSASLYKNGMPAQYGGRLSSVLDVELQEGDFNEYKGEVGLGLVASKLALQGPIVKQKVSFLIGGRASYSDWLLNRAKDLELRQSSAMFQDMNAKLAYMVNDKNKISYSGYYSRDGFKFAAESDFEWSMMNHVVKWSHIFSDRADLDVNFVVGNYTSLVKENDQNIRYDVTSIIDYQKMSVKYSYLINERHSLNAGLESTYYQFQPGNRDVITENTSLTDLNIEKEKSIETGIYLEDDFTVNSSLSIRAGLRFSHFVNLGPGIDYLYGANDSRKENNITDTVYYDNGEQIASYQGLEPRVTVNYELTPTSSIKMGYNRTRQYLHMISNTAAVSPYDIWKTSNYYIPPEIGDQLSLGYFRNFRENQYETSVEVYYKHGTDVTDFKNGKDLFMNTNLEADLLTGESNSYGIEFFVNKKMGKLTGWMSYTYSRSFRKVEGENDDETISNGDWYPSNYDKPHDFTTAINYQSTPLVSFSINFTYSTGRPVTAPELNYNVGNLTYVNSYSLRNELRIPDYHRLDISMNLKTKPQVERWWRASWTFAVYNVYGRKNAFSVYYKNEVGSPPSAYKLSVLGSAFPSIMLNIEF